MDINSYIASGIVELYVLGLCSAEEKAEVETLRRQHPSLNEAIRQYEINLEKELSKNGTVVPSFVDEKVLGQIDRLGTPLVSQPAIKKPSSNSRWLKLTAAAALVLLAGSAVMNYRLYRQLKEQKAAAPPANSQVATLPASDYAVMTNPAITPVAMYGVGTHAICRCTMFWDKKTGKLYIMIHHLPRSSEARDYQLWALVNGRPVSVGIINDSIRGRFIEMDNVPAGATTFTVTLEKAGGATTPTESEMYLKGTV
jgi:anti-sigma-K factor RskA